MLWLEHVEHALSVSEIVFCSSGFDLSSFDPLQKVTVMFYRRPDIFCDLLSPLPALSQKVTAVLDNASPHVEISLPSYSPFPKGDGRIGEKNHRDLRFFLGFGISVFYKGFVLDLVFLYKRYIKTTQLNLIMYGI